MPLLPDVQPAFAPTGRAGQAGSRLVAATVTVAALNVRGFDVHLALPPADLTLSRIRH